MKITLHEILVKDLIKGYNNDKESGQVVAFGGKLNVRPKYQREFVYKDRQRDAVIKTVLDDFPLNTMYWVKNTEKDAEFEFEVLDGQQRTISICEFAVGHFALETMALGTNHPTIITGYDTMESDQKERFLNYKLQIYFCEGEDSEKLGWFRTINIGTEKLTDQEIRNAIYHSAWLDSAKFRFSKRNAVAVQLAKDYLRGEAIRQDYLETALAWQVGKRDGEKIETFMQFCKAQKFKNADKLWEYFQAVIAWVKTKFPNYRKEMKGLEWGFFYNKYKDKELDAAELETRIKELILDDEVTSKKGIYLYLLSGNERALSLRQFSEAQRGQMYEKQKGLCANSNGTAKGLKGVKCQNEGVKLPIEQMHADHIMPWSKGGKTELNNCQMLCAACNLAKSDKV